MKTNFVAVILLDVFNRLSITDSRHSLFV